ncbi:MAG: NAD-dependent epimerase/dehydratase family protein [Proteobacteria bacterium]|nr:NAD-dependent epimerase/dehydratase family protein [Pseudomonadota bacterium]MBI3497778.1 NAD-dependent epimerase/dehydratase family protein [Pseudomonadota bacterium]
MARYLVTGGAGFIGSHLLDALTARGDGVRVLDDLSTGRRDNLPGAAELVVGDVADPALLAAAMAGCEGCFHLAAVASVERSVEDWLGTHRVNATGSIAVFDAARRAGAGRPIPVVYASSAATYGEGAAGAILESASMRPESAYGADKRASELHAYVAHKVHGVPTTGLRFFNVYGPRQDPSSPYSGVISIFADRIRQGRAITIHGDGSQIRDFIYVGDVVRFLLAAMARRPSEPGVYNVCSGRGTTIRELATTLMTIAGGAVEIISVPSRPGDLRHSLGDPALARRELGLSAETQLADGLRQTFAWRPSLAATG